MAKLHEKVANQGKNFFHHKSKKLAIYFEKSVTDNDWGMFTSFLTYKLSKPGKQTRENRQIISLHKSM